MVLAIESEDIGWVPCKYRERKEGTRVCTYGIAIYGNPFQLRPPSDEIIKAIRSRKPWLLEFGQIRNQSICENCPYNDLRRLQQP